MNSSTGIAQSVIDTVGETPLVRLNVITKNCPAEILLKCEYRNPLFSIKDRVAVKMIRDAESKGLLSPGDTIIEPTSGNTGIGLAFAAKVLGYKCILVMPEGMSIERRVLLGMLGAEIVLTPNIHAMVGAIEKAHELCKQYGGRAYIPDQFSNPANSQAHYETTGPELVQQTNGQIDAFIAGIGTGGTIMGTGRYLKEQIPQVKIIGVEPAESSVLLGNRPGPHLIQGIGAGFIPSILDVNFLDEVIAIPSEEAVSMARRLNAEEGLPVGISTGCNVLAAMIIAKRPQFAGKRIVTVASSAVERYMSTVLVKSVKDQVSHLPVSR
jgi:cysteine synthase A